MPPQAIDDAALLQRLAASDALNDATVRGIASKTVCQQRQSVDSLRRTGVARLTAAQHLGIARHTHGLDHLEDALANAAFTDLVVGAHQLERLALDQRILLLLERRAGLAEALATAARHRPARQSVGRHLVEEVRHRHVEHLGELVKPARTDAVGATLVLLDLLEGEPDALADFGLTHPEQRATLPNSGTNID